MMGICRNRDLCARTQTVLFAVDEDRTSKLCPSCGVELWQLSNWRTKRCPNPACRVGHINRDTGATGDIHRISSFAAESGAAGTGATRGLRPVRWSRGHLGGVDRSQLEAEHLQCRLLAKLTKRRETMVGLRAKAEAAAQRADSEAELLARAAAGREVCAQQAAGAAALRRQQAAGEREEQAATVRADARAAAEGELGDAKEAGKQLAAAQGREYDEVGSDRHPGFHPADPLECGTRLAVGNLRCAARLASSWSHHRESVLQRPTARPAPACPRSVTQSTGHRCGMCPARASCRWLQLAPSKSSTSNSNNRTKSASPSTGANTRS